MITPDQSTPAPMVELVHGNCLHHLRTMPDNSVDAIITDPPYGLSNTDPRRVTEAILRWTGGEREYVPEGKGFMDRPWDAFVPPPAVWDECLRVLKPGGHLAAFAGSRTQDLMGLSIRLAGFDVRESLAWMYGSGMPHGQDVGKTVEAQVTRGSSNSRALREVEQSGDGAEYVQYQRINGKMSDRAHAAVRKEFSPRTPEGQRWSGWNTSLKPAYEPIVLARKPLSESSVARNVLKHGTGALNVGACRIAHRNAADLAESTGKNKHGQYGTAQGGNTIYGDYTMLGDRTDYDGSKGRFPANVILSHTADCTEPAADGADQACAPGCQIAELDRQSGITKSSGGNGIGYGGTGPTYGKYKGQGGLSSNAGGLGDIGGASRFFYCAKAGPKERPTYINADGKKVQHTTVKPLGVMQWLVRLLTPAGGTVLDPFAGSGTTIEAAVLEGFGVIGIERETEYLPLIRQRIERSLPAPDEEGEAA